MLRTCCGQGFAGVGVLLPYRCSTFVKTCLLFVVFLLCALRGYGQTGVDTMGQLDSIVVLAKAIKPLGQPSTIVRRDWQTGKLASRSEEALLYLPGVYIRQRGPGQVASLQYRGLQGARIAQTWQGIPVSNPQLGAGDVNDLSLGLVDQIAFGSPTDIGNPAAVAVSQSPTAQTALTARYANGDGVLVNGQWKGLRLLFQEDKHAFNHSSYLTERKTKNPGVKTKTIGGSYTAALGRSWTSSSYFLQNDRKITVETFDFESFSIETKLRTTSARQLLTFQPDSAVRVDFGVLIDAQTYDVQYQSEASKGFTLQPLFQSQFKLSKNVRLTTDNRLLFFSHTEYSKNSLLPETRTLFHFNQERAGLALELTGGIHSRLNSGTVLFGGASVHKTISASERVQLGIRRIGRVPSLDDQRWQEGGNPDLLPEKGWEISSSSEGKIGPIVITPLVFARRFSNYILWLPRGNFWRPNSIPAVNNFGAGLDVSGRIGSLNHGVTFLGSFSYSELRLTEDYELRNRVFLAAEKNLPFSPKFTGSLTADYTLRKWSALVQGRFTGAQETAYNGLASADPFAVMRAAVSHQFKVLSITLSSDNLTNTIIPNDFGLYSPLRRFEVTLNYTPITR